MSLASEPVERLHNCRIPASVVSDPVRFGGRATDGYLSGDLILRDGIAVGMADAEHDAPPRLVLPALTEAHVHLDKCHTVDRLPDVGGDLRAAIEAQSRDKRHWDAEDLRQRARRGLEELRAAGCGTVRSHVDWPGGAAAAEPPLAWHVFRELAEDYRGQITLQLSALASLADLADPVLGPTIARHVRAANGALGAFVLDHDNRRAGIRAAFRLAAEHGIALDFHVDEGLETGLDGLSIIAETAMETGSDTPVLCGHACSLMNLTGARLEETLEKVRRAGITVVTLPTTNLYLQGRGPGTPDRRGLTRVRELQQAGVPVAVGTDNVRDAFCPVGRHDPRLSLALAVLAGHLDPPLEALWPMITTDARRALGLAPGHIDGARTRDLIILDAPSTTEALSGAAPARPLTSCLEGHSE